MVGGAAVEHTANIRMHDEFANALARDAHGHVHKHAVESLQLSRPGSCVPFLAFHNPSVLSEHAEVETVVNGVDPYERRVALERFVAKEGVHKHSSNVGASRSQSSERAARSRWQLLEVTWPRVIPNACMDMGARHALAHTLATAAHRKGGCGCCQSRPYLDRSGASNGQ